jgi:hypothetical protein
MLAVQKKLLSRNYIDFIRFSFVCVCVCVHASRYGTTRLPNSRRNNLTL